MCHSLPCFPYGRAAMVISRWLTARLFGTRSSTAGTRRRPVQRPRRPLAFEVLEGRAVPSVANILVNNPAFDTGSNDTQSETSLVLAGPGKVVVGFNDSGSNAGNNKFTG